MPGEEDPVGLKHIIGGEPIEDVGDGMLADDKGPPGDGCVDVGIPDIGPPGPNP